MQGGVSMNLSKRTWLKQAAATMAAATAGCVSRSGAVGWKPRLAFQVYGVREVCEKDFPGTLAALKAMGYEGVEAGRFFGRTPTQAAAIFRDSGLVVPTIQLSVSDIAPDRFDERLDFAESVGARNICLAYFNANKEDDWKALADRLSATAATAAMRGLRFCYHNHDHEFHLKFRGIFAWEFLYSRVSAEVLQEFDPGHCARAGQNPVAWLDRYPHRNPCIHMMSASDKYGAVGNPDDKVNWSAVLAACRRQGTEWLVIKPVIRPDSLEDCRLSYRYLRSIGV